MNKLIDLNLRGEGQSLLPYFHDVESSTPLSQEEEVKLAALIKEGDIEARNRLVTANLLFVITVVRAYQNRGISLPDLISAGNVGLITAAERFDGERGFKFITYAVWWIRQAIQKTIADNARVVRLPLNQLGLLLEINRAIERFRKQNSGANPTYEQISEVTGIPEEAVINALIIGQPISSLDDFVDSDEDRDLFNVIPDTRQEPPDTKVYQKVLKAEVAKILGDLTKREQFILTKHFGLDGEASLTLSQIGALLHLTRERVRQIKEKVFSTLQLSPHAHMLREILDAAYLE